MIYLDHNATTPLAREVLAAMLPVLERVYGNASSVHAAGREARAVIDDARDRLATLLRARPHEITFTGGGTEADNLAVIGLSRRQVREGRRKHLITSQVEHHAVLHAADYLEKHEGYEVTRLPVDAHGLVDLQRLEEALADSTALVSILSANNETGVIQPVAEIARLCKARGVVFHSDMVQSFGKQPLEVAGSEAFPDAISIAAHKFYGPKGVGALWLRAGVSLDAIAYGGAHENQRRPGTENTAAIAGLAAAAELATCDLEAEQQRQRQLRDALWQGIAAGCPIARLNGAPANPDQRLANTLNVSFPGCDGEGLLMSFDLAGIAVSSGSACMVGSVQPSHVLLAMGVEREVAQAAVRFSLGKGTTEDEVKKVVAELPVLIDRLLA